MLVICLGIVRFVVAPLVSGLSATGLHPGVRVIVSRQNDRVVKKPPWWRRSLGRAPNLACTAALPAWVATYLAIVS